jgi:hypothetical protein
MMGAVGPDWRLELNAPAGLLDPLPAGRDGPVRLAFTPGPRKRPFEKLIIATGVPAAPQAGLMVHIRIIESAGREWQLSIPHDVDPQTGQGSTPAGVVRLFQRRGVGHIGIRAGVPVDELGLVLRVLSRL